MPSFLVPECSDTNLSRDSGYRISIAGPLKREPPELPAEGYIRILELYGNEGNFINSAYKLRERFVAWKRTNQATYRHHQRLARQAGLDARKGFVVDGVYTSTLKTSPRQQVVAPAAAQAAIPAVAPAPARSSAVDVNEAQAPVAAQHLVPPQAAIERKPCNIWATPGLPITNEKRPACLVGFGGNFIPKEDETAMNGAGLAGIASTCAQMLDAFVTAEPDDPPAQQHAMMGYAREITEWLKSQGIIDAQRRHFHQMADSAAAASGSNNPFLTGPFQPRADNQDAAAQEE